MHSFKDSKDRIWEVSITISAIKRLRGLLEIDLLSIMEEKGPELYQRLMTDLVFLSDVTFALCKPHAESLSINQEDFDSAMDGPAGHRAAVAVLAEISDFFRQRHPAVSAGLDKMVEIKQLQEPLVIKQIQATTIESLQQRKSGQGSTELPGAAE